MGNYFESFFKSALPDDFSLEIEFQQVYLSFQNSSQYSDQS